MRVISRNRCRIGFANAMAVSGEDCGKRLPMIGVQETVLQMLDCVLEALERCSITTTEYPGTRAPCALLHGFDAPALLFFAWIQCHLSSQSISGLWSAMEGAAVAAARSRIQS